MKFIPKTDLSSRVLQGIETIFPLIKVEYNNIAFSATNHFYMICHKITVVPNSYWYCATMTKARIYAFSVDPFHFFSSLFLL